MVFSVSSVGRGPKFKLRIPLPGDKENLDKFGGLVFNSDVPLRAKKETKKLLLYSFILRYGVHQMSAYLIFSLACPYASGGELFV